MSRIVKRQFIEFDVEDTHNEPGWDFWQWWADGRWEHVTMAALDGVLTPGDLMWDVGAWIGPVTLWEARRGVNVIALEPDPVAAAILKANVTRLGPYAENVMQLDMGLSTRNGHTLLLANKFGNSQSSMIRSNWPNGGDDVSSTEINVVSYETLKKVYGTPRAMKIDVEGYEGVLIPHLRDQLVEDKVAVVLSTHPTFMNAEKYVDLMNAVRSWPWWQPIDMDEYLLRS